MVVASKPLLPRGIRNNNPGNIRLTNDQWLGMRAVQKDPDFVQFEAPEFGFRAMARVLRNYQRRGLTTIREIISTYAPESENATENYVRFVSDRLNISPEVSLELETVLIDLIETIILFENGPLFANFYSKQTIAQGVALA